MLSTLRPSDDDHLLRVPSSSPSTTTAMLAPPGHCKRRLACVVTDTGTGTVPAEEVECPELMDEEDSEAAMAVDSSHSDCSDPASPHSSSSWEIVASPSGPTDDSSAATEADADIGDDSSTATKPLPPTAASGGADTDTPSPSPVPPLEEEETVEEEVGGGEKGPPVTCDSEAIVVVSPNREEGEEEGAPLRRNNERHNLGMVNLGNTCYLNSAVQMLVSMGDFVRDLEAYDEAATEVEDRMKTARMMNESSSASEFNKSAEGDETDVANSSPAAEEDGGADTNDASTVKEKEEKKPSLRRELLNLARSLRLARPSGTDGVGTEEEEDRSGHVHSGGAASAVDPSAFKAAVDRLSCLFEGYRQQDSHEFLSTVLDLLQDEILDEEKRRRQFMEIGQAAEGGEGEGVSTDSEAVDTSRKSSGEDEISEEGTKPTDDAVSLKGGCRCTREDSSGPVDGSARPERRSISFSELGTEDISFLLGNDDSGGNAGPDIPQDVTVCTRRQEEKLKIPRTRERERSSSSSSYSTPTGLPLLLGGRMTTLATPGLFSSAWLPSPAKLRPVEAKTTTDDVVIAMEDDSEEVEVPTTDGAASPEGKVPPAADDAADDGSHASRPPAEEPEELTADEMSEGDAPSTTPHAAESCGAPDHQTGTGAGTGTEDASSSPAVSFADVAALRSPVEKHFGALVEVRLVCDSCSYTRTKTELYRYFSVDILPPATPNLAGGEDEADGDSRVATVEEGLRSFFAPEKIELKCEKCFCENATEYKEIVRLPSALLLHVKRFIVDYSPIRGVSFRKDKSRVEFGDDVDLNPYCCDSTAVQVDADEEVSTTTKDAPSSGSVCEEGDLTPPPGVSPPTRYTLKSVVHHIGSSASCGHYTADGIRLVASPPGGIDVEEVSRTDQATPSTQERTEPNEVARYENRWLHFDDGYVTEVPSHDEGTLLGPTAQATAYMVMYELMKGVE